MLVVLNYECDVYCAQNMLERARQRRAALEARLSNSDLSTPHKPSGETNYGIGLACIIFVIYFRDVNIGFFPNPDIEFNNPV